MKVISAVIIEFFQSSSCYYIIALYYAGFFVIGEYI